ncbi:hypothetical protein GCM10027081_29380 [Cupriavidus yeoncheonensis]
MASPERCGDGNAAGMARDFGETGTGEFKRRGTAAPTVAVAGRVEKDDQTIVCEKKHGHLPTSRYACARAHLPTMGASAHGPWPSRTKEQRNPQEEIPAPCRNALPFAAAPR